MAKKYIDAEKLIAEIKQQRSLIEGLFLEGDNSFYEGVDNICCHFLEVIDSLQQEQREVDLEKEIDECWQNWLSPSNQSSVEGVLPKSEFSMYARHLRTRQKQ